MELRKAAMNLVRIASDENANHRALIFDLASLCEDLAYEIERLQSQIQGDKPRDEKGED